MQCRVLVIVYVLWLFTLFCILSCRIYNYNTNTWSSYITQVTTQRVYFYSHNIYLDKESSVHQADRWYFKIVFIWTCGRKHREGIEHREFSGFPTIEILDGCISPRHPKLETYTSNLYITYRGKSRQRWENWTNIIIPCDLLLTQSLSYRHIRFLVCFYTTSPQPPGTIIQTINITIQ